jgi:thioredoxin 1
MALRDIQEADFADLVLRRQAPVLVAFRAGWCMPSVQLEPMLDRIAERYRDQVEVVAVDVGEDIRAHKLARRFQVHRVPVVMLFAEGRVKDYVGGLPSPETLTEMVDRQLQPVIRVDESNFDVEVRKSRVPVLIHIDAAWCSQSRELVPDVDEVAERFRGRAKVVRLEYGPETVRLCAEWGVTRVPTLALFEDGQLVDQIVGNMRGGAKVGAARQSCVGLTTGENIAQMLDEALV